MSSLPALVTTDVCRYLVPCSATPTDVLISLVFIGVALGLIHFWKSVVAESPKM